MIVRNATNTRPKKISGKKNQKTLSRKSRKQWRNFMLWREKIAL